MRVLVVNAGSSSLKLRVVDGDDSLLHAADLAAAGGHVDAAQLDRALAEVGEVDAVGHRVVHGGTRYAAPVVVDDGVMDELTALVDLAPLHQWAALDAVHAVSRLLPRVASVACFDTGFHASLPPAAATYAVPPRWRERWGVRRYGFHGLSHAYASRRAAELLGRPFDEVGGVTCHLGAGASVAAVAGGECRDTTMGFTPLEGLVMATRSGSVDPGLVLWMQEHAGLSAAQVAHDLEHESGLLGLAGTADMRAVVAAAQLGEPGAALALDVYVHRLRAGIAAMAAALGGLDVLVFTGGVGEGSPEVRRRTTAGLRFLGVVIDAARNEAPVDDADVSAADAATPTLVVRSREDLEIARAVRALLGS